MSAACVESKVSTVAVDSTATSTADAEDTLDGCGYRCSVCLCGVYAYAFDEYFPQYVMLCKACLDRRICTLDDTHACIICARILPIEEEDMTCYMCLPVDS
jgi:hypothetical protein